MFPLYLLLDDYPSALLGFRADERFLFFFYFLFFKSALATANTILGWPIACQGCPVPPRTPLWLRHCLIRKGGDVNGCHILPQPRFNSIDLRRTMNLRDNSSIDGSVTFSYFFL